MKLEKGVKFLTNPIPRGSLREKQFPEHYTDWQTLGIITHVTPKGVYFILRNIHQKSTVVEGKFFYGRIHRAKFGNWFTTQPDEQSKFRAAREMNWFNHEEFPMSEGSWPTINNENYILFPQAPRT
jgi:hypothetical protein